LAYLQAFMPKPGLGDTPVRKIGLSPIKFHLPLNHLNGPRTILVIIFVTDVDSYSPYNVANFFLPL
jgi:hypothetical protein